MSTGHATPGAWLPRDQVRETLSNTTDLDSTDLVTTLSRPFWLDNPARLFQKHAGVSSATTAN